VEVAATIRRLRDGLEQYGESLGPAANEVQRNSLVWGRVLLGHVAQFVSSIPVSD
jgi:hypothetical protein